MPVYSADNEELFLRENVPGRWDESSDIAVHVLVSLDSAADAGDDFKPQLSWRNTHGGSDDPETSVILDDTTHDVPIETNIVEARKAQYNNFDLLKYIIVTFNLPIF